jgi:hypothetical protein
MEALKARHGPHAWPNAEQNSFYKASSLLFDLMASSDGDPALIEYYSEWYLRTLLVPRAQVLAIVLVILKQTPHFPSLPRDSFLATLQYLSHAPVILERDPSQRRETEKILQLLNLTHSLNLRGVPPD